MPAPPAPRAPRAPSAVSPPPSPWPARSPAPARVAAIPAGGTGIPPNAPPSATIAGTPDPVVLTLIVADMGPGTAFGAALQLGTLDSCSAAGSADRGASRGRVGPER